MTERFVINISRIAKSFKVNGKFLHQHALGLGKSELTARLTGTGTEILRDGDQDFQLGMGTWIQGGDCDRES